MATMDELRLRIEEELAKALPADINSQWKGDSFGDIPAAVSDTLINSLHNPCHNLFSLGGKRWRPLLQVLCAGMTSTCLNQKENIEDAIILTPLVEFVHTASLIHDDIEDKADQRRGKPCAYITYGTDTAVNAGSWLYFESACAIERLECPDKTKAALYAMWAQELRRLHLGQAMDIYWHRNPQVFPTLEEYTAMVRHKTGTLSALAVSTGIICAGGTAEQYQKAGGTARKLGQAFQILDDVQNLTTGNPGKKRGDDIVEGKKSLPVLMHIQNHPEDAGFIADCFNTARTNGINDPAVEKCIGLLENAGSIQEAFNRGCSLVKETCRELTGIFVEDENSNSYAKMIHQLFNSMIPEV